MLVFNLPASLRSKIKKIQRTYLWGGSEGNKRLPLMAWDKVCLEKKEGGIDLRDLKDMNKALIGKLGWKLVTMESSVWTRILRAKYLGNPREFLS
eukprot:Gb_30565 [translate_table: standard]